MVDVRYQKQLIYFLKQIKPESGLNNIDSHQCQQYNRLQHAALLEYVGTHTHSYPTIMCTYNLPHTTLSRPALAHLQD